MAPKVYVSDDRLTSCPSCLNHIRVAPKLTETVCPFCEVSLTVAVRGTAGSGALGVLSASRSGKVAAALAGLGLTMTVACGDPDPVEEPDAGFNVEEGDADGDDVDEHYVPNQEEMMDYGDFPNDYPDELNIGEEEPDDDDEGNDGE